MAKVTRTTTELTDDIDGGEASETVSFALDGTAYEIDLNEANAAALRDAFAPYVGSARKAGRGTGASGRRAATSPRRAASGSATSGSGTVGDVRAWAREQGLKVSERGRLSGEIVAAYEAAH